MARARGEINWLWRLLLIPLFGLYLQMFECFDFVMHIGEIRILDYVWNLVFLGAGVVGVILLMAAAPGRKLLAALGMVLLLAPEILLASDAYTYDMNNLYMRITSLHPNVIGTAIRLTGAFWGLLMLRGPKKREWEKTVLWLIMIMRCAALFFWEDAADYGYIWYMDVKMFVLSVIIGAAADSVYRGLCLADVLVPVLAGAWIFLPSLIPNVEIKVILYAEAVLCVVYSTVLLCAKPARKMYWGFIFTLLGMVAYAAVYLLNGYI